MHIVSGTSPAFGSTHACRKSKHKHTLCTLYQAQAQPAVMCTLYQAQAKPVVAHMRVGKASTSTPVAHCIRHKPSMWQHTCVSIKQAQAHLVRIVSGTSPACGNVHIVSGTSPACGSTHACRKSKHKHTLCTLHQAQAQPAVMCTLYQAQAKPVVAHMRV